MGSSSSSPTGAPSGAFPAAQHKLASRSPLLRGLYPRLLGVLMPTFAFVAPRFDRRLLRAAGRLLAWSFWKVRPKYEHAVRRNIAQVRGLPPESAEVKRLAYSMHYHHAYFWIDMFAFSGRPFEEIERRVSYVHGAERLHQALDAGKGVILATAHVGNWELGGIILGKRNLPVTVVYSRDRFAEIERYRSRARGMGQVREVAVTDSPLSAVPLVAALRRGEIVALQTDRDWNDRGIAVPFFGKPAFFPSGPVMLAQATGAPIIFCLILHEPDMRYGIMFDEPLALSDSGDRRADLEQNVARVAARIEGYVRDHVDQWYCYYALWDDAEARLAKVAPGPRR